jgi:DNA end-binding protein Ku
MPKSIWNGTLTFGMVAVPIKLYSATESKSIHFHEVHAKDGARIEHRRICPKENREVPYKQVVKGYEVSPGRYVMLDQAEIKAAAGERGKVIHLQEFVRTEEIDPVFYERTYFVGSGDEKDSFRLLHEALRKTELAGIGRFSFHDREYLVAVRAWEKALVLSTLRFHDEVVSGDELELDGDARTPSKKEIEMAGQLVKSLAQDFDPGTYEDTYRGAILDLIRRKAKGKEIDLVAQEEPAHGDDLAAALEASLAGTRS